jgi:hypothetical protein
MERPVQFACETVTLLRDGCGLMRKYCRKRPCISCGGAPQNLMQQLRVY